MSLGLSSAEKMLVEEHTEALRSVGEGVNEGITSLGTDLKFGLCRLAEALEAVVERVVTEMELQRMERRNAE